MLMVPRMFGDVFDDWFDGFDRDMNRIMSRSPLYGKNAAKIMKTDVQERDGSYEIDIDLPGFKKEDVSVKLENVCLTVTASKGLDKDEQKEDSGYIRRERWSGSCSRSFYVGEDVRPEDIKAKMEDGILHLTMPKAEQKALPKQDTILIEG